MASMSDLTAVMPLVWLVLGVVTVLLLAVSQAGPRRFTQTHDHLLLVALTSVGLAAYALCTMPTGGIFWAGAISVRGSGTIIANVLLFGLAASMLTVHSAITERHMPPGETYALLLLAGCGMVLMALANDLLILFVGIELLSLASYGLVGILRSQKRSQEAALKYFLFGAFASACWILGQAYLYGETGRIVGTPSLRFGVVADAARSGMFDTTGTLGIALLLAVLLFKLGAAPFHLWAPDVYEGAPAAVTGMLAVGAKSAALLGLARLMEATLACDLRGVTGRETCLQLIEFLSVLSLLIGNCVALRQRAIKRLVAYSGIAHVGYLLLGILTLVAGFKRDAYEGLSFYLMGYSAATLGLLAVCSALETDRDLRAQLTLDRFRGLGRTHPFLAFALSVFLLSLAGIPPMAGFAGKTVLFSQALTAGRLAMVLGASVLSCVGAAYYLRLLTTLYLPPLPEQVLEQALQRHTLTLVIALCMMVTLFLGCLPEQGLFLARSALDTLGV